MEPLTLLPVRKRVLEICRRIIASALLGLGVYSLAIIAPDLLRTTEDWPVRLFILGFGLVFTGIPLGSAYLLFKKRDHSLAVLWTFLAAVILWSFIEDLPDHLGLDRFSRDHQSRWFHLANVAKIGWFIFSIFIARWFFHAVLLVLEHHLPALKPQQSLTAK